jgi:uncharacterized protein YgiM (DUF1202 family)
MQARVPSSQRAMWMVPLHGRLLVVLFAVVLGLPVAGFAQGDSNQPAGPVVLPGGSEAAREPAGPYVAEVTGNDVYIRSGPGTNFYHCGKLYSGDRVQIINAQQGWSCIVPPPGSFSWISMQYVSINLENPTMGVVTGDNVGVYAGSDYVLPMHSTSKQVSLNRGQIVKLLGEEKDDYYKIVPPQGAYLWVSAQFLRTVSAPTPKPPIVDVGAMVKPPGANPQPDVKAEPQSDIDIYYALVGQIKAEQEKPIDEQDYTEFKNKLAELAARKESGRAARYAEFTLEQVDRFELACKVAKELELQSKERQKVTQKIDEARVARLAQVVDLSKFAVMGKLENSSVFNSPGQAKRFRILNESGKTICYVMPSGQAATMDLGKFIGHKVGLVGKIEPHEATARAFVEFTEIVQLD